MMCKRESKPGCNGSRVTKVLICTVPVGLSSPSIQALQDFDQCKSKPFFVGEEMSEWIKCEDQMPSESGPCMVFKKNSAYQFGVYDWLRSEQCWEPELMSKKRSESKPKTWVTHWMPLPSAPEDSQ